MSLFTSSFSILLNWCCSSSPPPGEGLGEGEPLAIPGSPPPNLPLQGGGIPGANVAQPFQQSTRVSRTAWALIAFLALNVVVNLIVILVPWTGADYFQDLCVQAAKEEPRDVVLLGDSKVFPFVEGYVDCPFFDRPAYAFAMDSATVLYQRILYNRLISETSMRPKIVFYSTGANNFNENGLHIQRDYAMRFLATPSDLWEYRTIPGCLPYLVDSLISRLYPVYGRRIEISHLMFRGYKPREIDTEPPKRDPIADENYLLIYERGVLAEFQVSEFHLQNLYRWAQEIRSNGGELVVLDLPVTEPMRDLEMKVCKEWDEKIQAFSQETGVRYLDLRKHSDFSFRDINHLSNVSAKEVVRQWLQPLVDEALAGKRNP